MKGEAEVCLVTAVTSYRVPTDLLLLRSRCAGLPPFPPSIFLLLGRQQHVSSSVTDRRIKSEEERAVGTLGFLFLDGLSPSLLRRKAGVMRAALRSEL